MRCLAVLVCLLVGACASPTSETVDDPEPAPAPTRTSQAPSSLPPTASATVPSDTTRSPESPRASRSGTRIIVAPSDYGPMLYDASGQPIYLFTAESDDRPRCYGACAEDWPPVLTRGTPSAAASARTGLLDTTRRTDGSSQLTYAGHPLYFYAHESTYEVLCHNVTEYGGTWLVVQPDGSAAAA